MISVPGTRLVAESVTSNGLTTPDIATIPALLAWWADRAPDHPALLAPDRDPVTYGGLAEQVSRTVSMLASIGLGRGDRVAIVLPEGPDLIVALLAAMTASVAAPLSASFTTDEFAFALEDLGVAALVVQAGVESPGRAVAAARDIPIVELLPKREAGAFVLATTVDSRVATVEAARSEDVALVLHTSGSTDRPKRVPLTHANLLASARQSAHFCQLTPADRARHVGPTVYAAAIGSVLASLTAGASVVCCPGFDPVRFFVWIDEFRSTWFNAAPSIHAAILQAVPRHAGSIDHQLRFLRSGGGPLPAATLQGLETAFAAPLVEAYGLTETSPLVTSNRLPPGVRKARSVGVATGCEVRVVDDAGQPLPVDAEGEVVVRGPNVFAGYEDDPAATAAAFLPGGWFRTGDVGRLDQDGYLFLTGRMKEMINRGGAKVSPWEVEEVLRAHPAVAEVVVFALPDPAMGEDVAAVVVLHQNHTATEALLIEHVAPRLAPFKVPGRVILADDIPTGPTGKPRRWDLPEALGLAVPRQSTASPANQIADRASDTEAALGEIVASLLGIEEIDRNDDIFDLGADSLQVTRIMVAVRDRFGVDLPGYVLFEASTIATLAGRVEAARHDTEWRPVDGASHPDVPSTRLVALQPLGDRSPLFLLPGALDGPGGVIPFARLARAVGSNQPCYGFLAEGIVPPRSEEDPDRWLAMTATRCLRDIRRLKPSGPYLLGGGCLGGVIAVEMATQLREAGEQVAALILIDTLHPRLMRSGSREPRGTVARASRARWTATFRSVVRAAAATAPASLKRQVTGRPPGAAADLRGRDSRAGTAGAGRARARARVDAVRRTHPRPYPDQMVLVVNEEWHQRHPNLGWGDVAGGGVEVHVVPGTHRVYRDGHVAPIVPWVRACLDRAHRGEEA